MAILSEILEVLDRWSDWRRMREAPGRLDELERRVAALEAAPTGDCPSCRKGNLGRHGTVFRRSQTTVQKWRCTACNHVEERPT